MGLEEAGVESGGVHVSKAVKTVFVFFLHNKVVGRGSSIMFIGLEALSGEILVKAMGSDLVEDILVDRNFLLSDQNSRTSFFLVQFVEVMSPDFHQSISFCV